MGVGPVGFSVEQQNLLWAMWHRGDSIREMERTLGETLPRIRMAARLPVLVLVVIWNHCGPTIHPVSDSDERG